MHKAIGLVESVVASAEGLPSRRRARAIWCREWRDADRMNLFLFSALDRGSTIEAARQLLGPKHQSFLHCCSPWIFTKTVREPRPTKLLERFSSNYSH
jgi:hypothetical protein